MRLKHAVLLSLVALTLIGHSRAAVGRQAAASSSLQITNMPARSPQPERIAQSMSSTKPTTIKSGSFTSGEHATQGGVRLVTQNGKVFLDLDQGFKTSSSGPDLVVLLHRSSNVLGSTKPPSYPLKSGEYVFLAPLQKFNGAQRYAIPASVNVAEYKSAVVWCRKFNATFGAAKLN